MVKCQIWFLIVFILLAIVPPAFSDDFDNRFNAIELQVSVSKAEKQLGQYFRVTIRYTGTEKWSKLNLQKWQSQFKIIQGDQYQDEDEHDRPVKILKLRLYPRSIGKLELSALKLGDASSRKLYLQVNSPVVDDSPIKLNWSLSSASPWQRQPIILTVQLQTRDVAAHVLLSLPEMNNIQLRSLPITRKKTADGLIHFATGWVYYPFSSGDQVVDFPAIHYQLSGSDRRRFYLPLQLLRVKGLPSYLPPNLPVGKPDLSSELIANDTKWQITMKTRAYVPHGIGDIVKQLAFYGESDMADVYVSNITNGNKDQSIYHYVYTSSLPSWLMPVGADLCLNLRYFDTDTGKLNNVTLILPRVFNAPLWAWFIFITFCCVLTMLLIYKGMPLIKKIITKCKVRHRIKKANNLQQIRMIILNNGEYITLEQWAGDNERKKVLKDRVNYYCYSKNNKSDYLQLKHALLRISCF